MAKNAKKEEDGSSSEAAMLLSDAESSSSDSDLEGVDDWQGEEAEARFLILSLLSRFVLPNVKMCVEQLSLSMFVGATLRKRGRQERTLAAVAR